MRPYDRMPVILDDESVKSYGCFRRRRSPYADLRRHFLIRRACMCVRPLRSGGQGEI